MSAWLQKFGNVCTHGFISSLCTFLHQASVCYSWNSIKIITGPWTVIQECGTFRYFLYHNVLGAAIYNKSGVCGITNPRSRDIKLPLNSHSKTLTHNNKLWKKMKDQILLNLWPHSEGHAYLGWRAPCISARKLPWCWICSRCPDNHRRWTGCRR